LKKVSFAEYEWTLHSKHYSWIVKVRERKKESEGIKRKERDKWIVSSPFLSPIQERDWSSVGPQPNYVCWTRLGHDPTKCCGTRLDFAQPFFFCIIMNPWCFFGDLIFFLHFHPFYIELIWDQTCWLALLGFTWDSLNVKKIYGASLMFSLAKTKLVSLI